MRIPPQRYGEKLFGFLDVHRPWRKVKVPARRAAEDFAIGMRELSDIHCPDAERIRVVLHSLSNHIHHLAILDNSHAFRTCEFPCATASTIAATPS